MPPFFAPANGRNQGLQGWQRTSKPVRRQFDRGGGGKRPCFFVSLHASYVHLHLQCQQVQKHPGKPLACVNVIRWDGVMVCVDVLIAEPQVRQSLDLERGVHLSSIDETWA